MPETEENNDNVDTEFLGELQKKQFLQDRWKSSLGGMLKFLLNLSNILKYKNQTKIF